MTLPSRSMASEHGNGSSAREARPPAPLVPGIPIPAFVLSDPVRSFSSLITPPVLSANSRRPPLAASGAHGVVNATCRPGPGPPAPPANTVTVPARGPAAGTARAAPAASAVAASTPAPNTLTSSPCVRRPSPRSSPNPHPAMTNLSRPPRVQTRRQAILNPLHHRRRQRPPRHRPLLPKQALQQSPERRPRNPG